MFVAVVFVPKCTQEGKDRSEGEQFDPGRDHDGLSCLLGLAHEVESGEDHLISYACAIL